jgi:hypothetical protein
VLLIAVEHHLPWVIGLAFPLGQGVLVIVDSSWGILAEETVELTDASVRTRG